MFSTLLAETVSSIGSYYPFLVLLLGTAAVLGIILIARLNAFIALIIGAFIVSLMATNPPPQLVLKSNYDNAIEEFNKSGDVIPLESEYKVEETKVGVGERMVRVAKAFGNSAGGIGIVIAFAAIVGICMLKSGAADRIVQFFLSILGEKRGGPIALTASGYVLSIPVFFDTVFYLLVPLARSMFRKTNRNYLLYLVAIAAGGAVTHTLVPPTPGPTAVALSLKVDLGVMILIGSVVGIVSSVMGLLFGYWLQSKMTIEMRETLEDQDEALEETGVSYEKIPGLFVSLLPVILPVILISMNTIFETWVKVDKGVDTANLMVMGFVPYEMFKNICVFFGDKNFALGVSAVLAMWLYWKQCKPSSSQFTQTIESALMSGGVIILITAAGGAFGGMLKLAGLGDAIQHLLSISETSKSDAGYFYLFLAFGIAALFKTCQGSSTTAMLVTPGIVVSLIPGLDDKFTAVQLGESLGYHPVYLALAIGSGSLCLSWMNDSGFWIFSKMGGLTEKETLKSWTPLLFVLGFSGLVTTTILVTILPFPLAL